MSPKPNLRAAEPRDRVFTISQWLPLPLEEAFSFFGEAQNLEQITPPFLSFRIITPTPIEMQVGALIDYQLRVRGIPIKWRTEITDWDPPHGFTDVQLRGPYRKWVHRHDFIAEKEGTRVVDTVNYLVPGGMLINQFLIKSELRRIFDYRCTKIEQILIPGK